jgi:phosphatidate cytidylyltransferase
MSTPPSRSRRRAARSERDAGAAPTSKAGRNLPVAIAVGVALGGLVLASLLIDKRGFIVVATAASVIGAYELLQALGKGGVAAPAIPVFAAAFGVPVAAYAWGPPAVAPAVVLAILAVVVTAALGSGPTILREAAGGVLIVLYPATLVAFALLLLRPDDGIERVVTFVVVTICSDIGGYAAGVLFGKHPMAPSVSPKKSWEGFAGSAAGCVIAGVLCVTLLLDGAWWIGLLLGLAVVVAATVGDLCESMIKRDLGIKDMSNLIPGHGGLMDRLDSLALSVPVTWAILTFVSSQ